MGTEKAREAVQYVDFERTWSQGTDPLEVKDKGYMACNGSLARCFECYCFIVFSPFLHHSSITLAPFPYHSFL